MVIEGDIVTHTHQHLFLAKFTRSPKHKQLTGASYLHFKWVQFNCYKQIVCAKIQNLQRTYTVFNFWLVSSGSTGSTGKLDKL